MANTLSPRDHAAVDVSRTDANADICSGSDVCNDVLGRCDAVAMATVMEIAVLFTGAEHGVIIVEWGGWGGVNVTPTVTDQVPTHPANQSGPPDTPSKS